VLTRRGETQDGQDAGRHDHAVVPAGERLLGQPPLLRAEQTVGHERGDLQRLVVTLQSMVCRDPSLAELADLPAVWRATHERVGSACRCSPQAALVARRRPCVVRCERFRLGSQWFSVVRPDSDHARVPEQPRSGHLLDLERGDVNFRVRDTHGEAPIAGGDLRGTWVVPQEPLGRHSSATGEAWPTGQTRKSTHASEAQYTRRATVAGSVIRRMKLALPAGAADACSTDTPGYRSSSCLQAARVPGSCTTVSRVR
jgi:hypothetical protein